MLSMSPAVKVINYTSLGLQAAFWFVALAGISKLTYNCRTVRSDSRNTIKSDIHASFTALTAVQGVASPTGDFPWVLGMGVSADTSFCTDQYGWYFWVIFFQLMCMGLGVMTVAGTTIRTLGSPMQVRTTNACSRFYIIATGLWCIFAYDAVYHERVTRETKGSSDGHWWQAYASCVAGSVAILIMNFTFLCTFDAELAGYQPAAVGTTAGKTIEDPEAVVVHAPTASGATNSYDVNDSVQSHAQVVPAAQAPQPAGSGLSSGQRHVMAQFVSSLTKPQDIQGEEPGHDGVPALGTAASGTPTPEGVSNFQPTPPDHQPSNTSYTSSHQEIYNHQQGSSHHLDDVEENNVGEEDAHLEQYDQGQYDQEQYTQEHYNGEQPAERQYTQEQYAGQDTGTEQDAYTGYDAQPAAFAGSYGYPINGWQQSLTQLPNSDSSKIGPQNGGSAAAAVTVHATAIVAPVGPSFQARGSVIREDKVQEALKFLQHPQVEPKSESIKRAFLKSKYTEEEVEEALMMSTMRRA